MASSAPPSYFVDHKKGEVNELKAVRMACEDSGGGGAAASPSRCVDQGLFPRHRTQNLRNIAVERDPRRKRDLIKKVIAYMTLGIDVSRLYSEMVLVRGTAAASAQSVVCEYPADSLRTHCCRHPTPRIWLSRRWCTCTSPTTPSRTRT